jgi:multiple sugar transport system ATP-binding protein
MGRAIVRNPQAYLMDEPLSNLDAKLRVHMRAEIASLQNDLGVTTVYVTHDQVEAMTMGDRVAVMRKGELQQVAPPQVLYERPVNLFVGGFIGSPAMNLAEAGIVETDGRFFVEVGAHRLALSDELLAFRPKLRDYVGKRLVVGIRPENLEDAALEPETPEAERLRGVVVLREPLGSEIVAHFTVSAPPALTEDVRELARDVGQETTVQATVSESGAHETVMVGRFGPRSRIKNGDVVDIAVETGALHFFDIDSGLGIYGNTENGRPATEQAGQEGDDS